MHTWGDDVDWEGITRAAIFIGKNLRRWGRVGVTNIKEKYGTVRVYCCFGWFSLHDIFYPGYARNQFPSWLFKLDIKYGSFITKPLDKLVRPYQEWMYRFLYKRAIQKWPHLKEEILCCADFHELLKGL